MRAAWERGIRACAQQPNMYCKLSGLSGAQGGMEEAAAQGGVREWSADSQEPTVRFCVEHFSSRRLLFGGDWPVCTLCAPLAQWTRGLQQILREAGWSARDVAQLAANAEECYRL